jgi:hypothetical protein
LYDTRNGFDKKGSAKELIKQKRNIKWQLGDFILVSIKMMVVLLLTVIQLAIIKNLFSMKKKKKIDNLACC